METKNVVVLAVIGITLQKRTNNNKYKQIINPPPHNIAGTYTIY